MAHECTSCGRVFEEGSTDMLSGCPECGGNRFQYLPSDALETDAGESSDDIIEADEDPSVLTKPSRGFSEGHAQVAARSDSISKDQLPEHKPAEQEQVEHTNQQQSEDCTGLAELREELDDRFESIKIVDRGEYELNLMELFERRECIIELQENGRYVIEVPETLTDG